MTFYNLQNFAKLLPKMQKRTFQGDHATDLGLWVLRLSPPGFLTMARSLVQMSSTLDLLYGTCKINGSVLFYYVCFFQIGPIWSLAHGQQPG